MQRPTPCLNRHSDKPAKIMASAISETNSSSKHNTRHVFDKLLAILTKGYAPLYGYSMLDEYAPFLIR